MNNFLFLIFIFLFPFNVNSAEEKKPEVKKVCVDEKQKDGKIRQVCKTIKVHKKLDGTQVPGQKK